LKPAPATAADAAVVAFPVKVGDATGALSANKLFTVILLVTPDATTGTTSVAPVVDVTAGSSEILTSAAYNGRQNNNIKSVNPYIFFIAYPP
jgi:hypothetical protein